MWSLTIRDLKKSFRSPDGESSTIVDVESFSMNEGAQLALKGTSGSGKTTFLNLIAGILTPDSGTIEITGEDICQMSEGKRDLVRAQHIGYVFQTFNLLHGYTAMENVLLGMIFGPGPDPAYAKELLNRVGLADRMNYKPRQLSVGQQQRVAVARALANKPSLVLADEPTGNLDVHHAKESLTLIREICEENQAALLLVSHDPAIVNEFDDHLDFAEMNRAASFPSLGGSQS
jgi:putative ABC transport system ATP-binding protein